eukprot:scaffold926_cov408-Prasinococcus_capsulatus_cf.AAC.27
MVRDGSLVVLVLRREPPCHPFALEVSVEWSIWLLKWAVVLSAASLARFLGVHCTVVFNRDKLPA